jgi:thiamine biosynthesis lipoprotein
MGTYAIIDLPSEKAYQAYKFMKGLEEKLSDYIEGL